MFIPVDRHDRGNRDAGRDWQDIHNRLALCGSTTLRQAPGLKLVGHAIGCEEQKLRVCIRDKQRGNDIVVFRLHARQTFTTAFLRAEIGERGALDIAGLGDRHDHVFTLDQVFVLHVA